MSETTTTDGPDLIDPATYVNGFPHDYFTELRAAGPVHRHPHPDWGHIWSVVRLAEIREISRHAETFSSSPNPFLDVPEGDTDGLLISLDPPEHTRMRMLVSKGFTPRRVRDLETRIAHHVDRMIDDVADQGGCEMVGAIASELPLQVIAEMVGVPEEDRRQVFHWTEESFGFDPEVSPDQRREAATAMFVYADELCQERQKHPQDDLMSALVDAEVDGHKLTQMQIDLFFLLLQNAGSETTRNLITSGTIALLEHPDQLAWLTEDLSGRLPTAIEELLRWATPILQFTRRLTSDTVLGGQEMAAGDHVAMWYPSANRDELVFERPFELDLARDPNEHIAFGSGGPHFCLGANLARLEGRIIFESLLTRIRGLRLDGDPATLPRVHSNLIDGPATLPLAWDEVVPAAAG